MYCMHTKILKRLLNSFVPGKNNSNRQNSDRPTGKQNQQQKETDLPIENPMENPNTAESKPSEKEPKPGESTFDPMNPKV